MYFKIISTIIVAMLIGAILYGCSCTKPPMEGTKEQLTGSDKPSWIEKPREEDTKTDKAFLKNYQDPVVR